MTRAILLAALFAPFAAAQPPTPANPPAAPAPPMKDVTNTKPLNEPLLHKDAQAKPLPEKPKPTLDQIIAASMHSNPDVKIAEAEVQLAQAKLNAVKVAATQKVIALKEAIDECERKLLQERNVLAVSEVIRAEAYREIEKGKKFLEAGREAPGMKEAKTDLARAEATLTETKANIDTLQTTLARHQQEWKRLSEAAEKSARLGDSANAYIPIFDQVSRSAAFSTISPPLNTATATNSGTSTSSGTSGSTYTTNGMIHLGLTYTNAKLEPESLQGKLRLALDKPIAFERTLNGIQLDEALDDLFKKADLKIQVHKVSSTGFNNYTFHTETRPGTLPLASWLQLMTDCMSDQLDEKDLKENRVEFYVRDYGLQLASKKTAAPGAIPLSEFWKSPKPEATKK